MGLANGGQRNPSLAHLDKCSYNDPMPKLDAATIERYQKILEKDPSSQVFAPLAEAYREMNMLPEAERMARLGVKKHPRFVSGLVTLAKILRDQSKSQESLGLLQRAIELAPENILAHHLLGETHLALRDPKAALKSFKRVLFLNPQSNSAQKAVQKLESLTADEYDAELFAMTKLTGFDSHSAPENLPKEAITSAGTPVGMERLLSLVDAFIVRNDLDKAKILIEDGKKQFGIHPEIERRLRQLKTRMATELSDTEESPTPLAPLESRSLANQDHKLRTLQMMLRKIEEYRSQY